MQVNQSLKLLKKINSVFHTIMEDGNAVSALEKQLLRSYVIQFYERFPNKDQFWNKNNFVDKLWGSDELRKWLVAGWTEDQIRATWQEDLARYKQMRKKYLLYDDFE